MADPSRAATQTAYSNAVKILNETYKYGRSNATNFLSLLNSFDTALVGDYADTASAAGQTLRSLLAGMVSSSVAADILRPWLQTYCKSVIGRTDLSNDAEMINEIYLYMVANALRVQSKTFTFGTPTANGSNIGNGQILRLTKDNYNFDIESGYVDSKRVKCILDQNTGTAQGNEVWQIVGQARARDDIQRSGSGQEGTLTGYTIDDSLLTNAGFRAFSGTASVPTGLTGWTSSAGDSSSIYTLDSTNYFRPAPSDGDTSYALNLAASTNLTQKLTVRGTELSPNVPYLLLVIWNRQVGSASGTLTCRMGAANTAVSVAAQTGWVVTTVPNPIGQSCWYRQFAKNDMQIEVQWARSGGSLLIGEVLFVPGQQFDNHYYWPVPASTAAYTAARILDSFTFPDIATASNAANQTWLTRAFPGAYFPHAASSAVTWADA